MVIHEIEIDSDRIYLKKSKLFGWSVVQPIKTDNKTNLKNLLYGGSLWNLLLITIIVFMILAYAFEYTKNLDTCAKVIEWYNVQNNVPNSLGGLRI